MTTVTGEQGTDDMVRVEFKIEASGQIFLTQDEWEKFDAGDAATHEYVANQLYMAEQELKGETSTELTRAVLVEADGYLGTDISVLKKF